MLEKKRLIMAVAQQPFDSGGNQFCKLVPVVYVDGEIPNSTDFPNDGEIWWMLTDKSASLAEPGRIVSGRLQLANDFNKENELASMYQVARESISTIDSMEALQIIPVPTTSIGSIDDVMAEHFRLSLSTKPTSSVILRWRQKFYGPFTSNSDSDGQYSEGKPTYFFRPAGSDFEIAEFTAEELKGLSPSERFVGNLEVSLTDRHRVDSSLDLKTVEVDLLLGAGFENLLSRSSRRLSLEPLDRKLNRFAKQVFTRKERQELRQLLESLELRGRETDQSKDLIDAIQRVEQLSQKQDESLDAVCSALLENDFLGVDRIEKVETAIGEEYIRTRSAILQSEVEENIAQKRAELKVVEREVKELRAGSHRELERKEKALRQKVEFERVEQQRKLAAERSELEKQRSELSRQEKLLQENLQKVTSDLRDAGDEVVNRFLTIAPLLQLSGLAGEGRRSGEEPRIDSSSCRLYSIPEYISQGTLSAEQLPSEQEFLERFKEVVNRNNFMYREVDLITFHLSVKCNDLTILEGPSGCGKSSLPLLYSRALLGEQVKAGRPDCLMISVNPSWMESRDLIGHMNSLEGKFYPSGTGLFEYLIAADAEYREHQGGTGLYLACLDEMNLAQPEHYFSDLMMTLERSGEQRSISCFSAENASPACPYRNWPSLRLSRALRFVGTVNFDETTRLLSNRLLDRSNVIRLKTDFLPAGSRNLSELASAPGHLVTLEQYESWIQEDALDKDLISLLDELRTPLYEIGCPISPRAYRSICRFVSSAGSLLSPQRAFDLQLTQRVLPKVGHLITRRQLDALDGLIKKLKSSTISPFEETIERLELVKQYSKGRDWMMED